MRVASRSPFCKGRRALLVRLAWLQTKLIGVEIWSVVRQYYTVSLPLSSAAYSLPARALWAGQGAHIGATQKSAPFALMADVALML